MIVSTDAVILQSRKYGDTSKIISVYTKDFGKASLIAKGARQTKSKFGGSLEPLSFSHVSYYIKPGSDLHLLSNSETVTPLRHIQESVEHLSAGLSILESVALTQTENEKNEDLFDALTQSLILLNKVDENPFSIFVSFQILLAKNIGFGLNFEHYDSHELFFSLEEGSINSSERNFSKNSIKISVETIGILKKLAEIPIESSIGISIDNKTKQSINDFFMRYFSYHLEKRFFYRAYNLLKSN